MSDFDKEAERERLREKYEREQADREATEKMSELLLQGATMTNAHCSECGDPIFRYEGQEFCATCEKAIDRDTGESDDGEQAEEGAAGDQEGDDETERDRIEVTSPDDAARVKFGSDETATDDANPQDADPDQQPASKDPETSSPEQRQTADSQTTPEQQSRQTAPQRDQYDTSRGQAAGTQSNQQSDPGRRAVSSVEPTGSDDVSAARQSLVRTLTHFSQQAEATEDPQRAREYLAAAREAAEALSALRR